MSSRFFIFWMIIILNIGFTASAQKVGLVLSGGGSKGIAHIGVIRALEDNGIPIDYITGTSMGAIIGGLYAAGYSPDEMEEIVTSKDFSYWVSGELGVEYTYFFKQEEPNPSWINLRFNYDSVLTTNILPTNLVSPQQMDYAFMKYFSGATALAKGDFDHLLIPFRCVASDVATKKQAVLKSGDLGRAIRASMTFPFYFRPIMIDRKLMFDGGMYNNFPTDVMLDEFYPDIIIGSKVAGNYGPPKNNDILSQLQSMLMVDSKYDVPCDNGVLIEPKLKEVNVVDFSHSREFIDSGYVATLRMIPEIRKFQTLYVTQETMSAKRKAFRDSIPPLNIGSIYVNGLKKNQSEYVRWHLFHKEPTVPIEKMKPDYFKLLSDNQISYIFPTLKYNPIHKWYDLHLDVEKENNINVQFGGTISTSPVNEAFLGLRYKRLAKSAAVYRANIYIGRIFSSAEFGARWDFPFTIPNYLDMVLGFNQWDYFKTSTYFFVDKTPSYLIQKELKVEINYGVPYGRTSKFEFGAAVASLRDDYYQLNEFTRSDIADKTYFDLITPKVSYEANTLNDKQFANQGSRFFGDIHYVNGTEKNVPGTTSITDSSTSVHQDWFQLRMDYDNYYKKLGKLKLGFYSELMLSNKKLYNNYTSSLLSSGVFAPFAYARIIFMPEFRANSFMAVGLKNVYMISKSFDFRLEGYAFRPFSQIIKIGNNMAAYDNKSPGIKYMATSAFVFHSPIGPASLSVNWFDRNQDRFSFGFTIGYIIFNKRVLD